MILALVFSLLIALFAVANTEPVNVNYIFGESEVSLIILILGSAFAGALVVGLFSLFHSISAALNLRQVRRENDSLEKKVKALEEDKVFLEAELNRAISVTKDSVETETAAGWETKDADPKNGGADNTGKEETGPAKEGEDHDPDEPER